MASNRHGKPTILLSATALLLCAPFLLRSQQGAEVDGGDPPEIKVEHPECVYFGPKHDRIVKSGLNASKTENNALSDLTDRVTRMLATSDGFGSGISEIVPGGSRTNTSQRGNSKGTIDRYLFAAMQQAGVTPAARTNDFEFIRRVTLDLTGRIPTADRLLIFLGDSSKDKRAKYVDELLARPEYVDKWTQYFGDHFKNNSVNSQIRRFPRLLF